MAAAATDNDNLTDTEIEMLLSSAPNVDKAASAILITGQGMYRKNSNPITCIPEPSTIHSFLIQ